MISTFMGRIASIGEGKMIKGSDGQQIPVIDFQIAIDRGNYKKRISLLNGKEYDSDFYKVSIFGQSAISFHQYASKGRDIQVSGRLVQEEFLSKDQLVQIMPTNPLFQLLAPYANRTPDIVGAPDGCVYIKANHPVNRASIICTEYRWTSANPNQQSGAFSNFQTPQNSNSFTNTGFNGSPQFSTGAQGFNQVPVQGAFGAVQPSIGFGATPAPTGFGTVPAPTGFSTPATTGFNQNPQQVQPQSFPGFGGESMVPASFNQTPNNVNGGFASMPTDMDNGSISGFTPSSVGDATGFAPQQNIVQQPVQPMTVVESNIPAPTDTNINANGNAVVKTDEQNNQGF